MNLGEILPHLEQNLLLYSAGITAFSLIIAYVIYRLFGRKGKSTKGKPKKRSSDKRKSETPHSTEITKAKNDSPSKKPPNRLAVTSKRGDRTADQSPTDLSFKTSNTPGESKPEELTIRTKPDSNEDQWITVVNSKKEKKTDTGAVVKTKTGKSNDSPTKQKIPNKVASKQSKTESQKPILGHGKPQSENLSIPDPSTQTPDEDTEEEWREVRFSRKGGKYKRSE